MGHKELDRLARAFFYVFAIIWQCVSIAISVAIWQSGDHGLAVGFCGFVFALICLGLYMDWVAK